AALTDVGAVFTWGANEAGQLGNGGFVGLEAVPAQVKGPGGTGLLGSVFDISANFATHTIVLARASSAAVVAPAITRTSAIAITLSGDGVFPIDGYHVSENPTPPAVESSAWLP